MSQIHLLSKTNHLFTGKFALILFFLVVLALLGALGRGRLCRSWVDLWGCIRVWMGGICRRLRSRRVFE